MSVTTVAAAAPVRTSLGGTAVRGVAWLFAQNVATRFMVLAGQMLLARLLSPADFGVFGLAGTVVNVVSMVGDFGVQDVVLQRQRALRHWLTPAFWTSSLLGGAGLALVLLSAPLLSRLYAAPELPAMLALMGLAIPLTALANVPCILLRAQLRFRDLAMVGGAEVVGVQVLTVAFAAARMGPYSFVLPLPIVALIRTAALWVTTRPTIGRPRLAHVRKILARGSHLLGTKVITAAVSQGDYFVLGLFTSKAAVGAYYFAFRLAVQPLQLLATSVTNVVFPVLAQMGSDQARQRAAALAAARVLAYVAMPCCFLAGRARRAGGADAGGAQMGRRRPDRAGAQRRAGVRRRRLDRRGRPARARRVLQHVQVHWPVRRGASSLWWSRAPPAGRTRRWPWPWRSPSTTRRSRRFIRCSPSGSWGARWPRCSGFICAPRFWPESPSRRARPRAPRCSPTR